MPRSPTIASSSRRNWGFSSIGQGVEVGKAGTQIYETGGASRPDAVAERSPLSVPRSSAGFAGATDSWGEASEGGRSPPPRVSMDLVLIAQGLLNGLLFGGVYSLMAVGLTLIFGVMRVVNFAHGDMMVWGM